MKTIGITSTAVLALLLGIGAPAWAQEHEQEVKDKPAQQEEKKAQPEKSAAQKQEPAAQQEKNAKPEEKKAQPEKSAAQKQEPAAQQEKNAKPEEKKAQEHPVQAQPAKQAQHSAGGRIPADRFKANFGQQHTFHVSQADYSRDHRFQFGGYSFGFVDPWPNNWLYTQNVYVIEINGVYYLCNPMYPGVNIRLSIGL